MKINCIAPKQAELRFKAEKKEETNIKAEIKPLRVYSDDPKVLMAQIALPMLIIFPVVTKALEMAKLMKPIGAKTRFKYTLIISALSTMPALLTIFADSSKMNKVINDTSGFVKEVLVPYKVMFTILKDKITGKRPWNQ
jgi:hypothetical protein